MHNLERHAGHVDAAAFGNVIHELVDHQVLQLRTRFKGIINYNYVVVAGGEAVLVDPAWEPDLLLSSLARVRAKAAAIVLTHSHVDHVDLASVLAEQLEVPIYMHRKEAEAYGYRDARLQLLEDDQVLYVGGVALRAVATPGHTAGSVCYLTSGALISGDTLFNEGCGVCHVEGGCAFAMFHSLSRLLQLVPPSTLLFPGHSFGSPPGMPLSQVQKMNVYLRFRNAEQFAKFRMRADAAAATEFV